MVININGNIIEFNLFANAKGSSRGLNSINGEKGMSNIEGS